MLYNLRKAVQSHIHHILLKALPEQTPQELFKLQRDLRGSRNTLKTQSNKGKHKQQNKSPLIVEGPKPTFRNAAEKKIIRAVLTLATDPKKLDANKAIPNTQA